MPYVISLGGHVSASDTAFSFQCRRRPSLTLCGDAKAARSRSAESGATPNTVYTTFAGRHRRSSPLPAASHTNTSPLLVRYAVPSTTLLGGVSLSWITVVLLGR